jgi:1-deoxy-D-xylulose-5-phosphate synthase
MRKRLRDIRSPADLKGLSTHELRSLADEIRDRIIETTSRTGGHLASNLGTVELTLALHHVLDTPRDRIIWDVSHQCYAHKLLTGRQEQFPTLRQLGGLSGFCMREESEYDAFGAGHGSTSVSAALGFAVARDLRGSSERILAVIGDGALTGGLALEGLNQAGDAGADITVVLNDNEMSISRNVGALSTMLSQIRANVTPAMRRARADVNRMLERLPMGEAMVMAMDRFRDGVKELVIPGMFFEHLGFTYLGPIDGHDLDALIEIISDAVGLPGPALVHVLTTKGKGYRPAERDPRRFHGTGPFDAQTGQPANDNAGGTYSAAFGEALAELAGRDDRIVAITAAMIDGTGLERFKRRFPTRCFDVGLCEEHAVTFAAGLAAAGMRPVVAVYSTFLQRSYDQIIHDVCLQNLPVVFALDRGGLVGDDGPTHHGVFDIGYMRHPPNMTAMAPRDEFELADMLLTALSLDGPASLRYPRAPLTGVQLNREPQVLPVGRAELLREGADVAIVAVGALVAEALAAAETLAEQGIEAAVVNARFIKPLDEELICSLARSVGRLVTVEEGILAGGFGAGVAEMLADRGITGVSLARLGIADGFVPCGDRRGLLEQWSLDRQAIARSAAALCRPHGNSASSAAF